MRITFFEFEKWEEKFLKEQLKNHELVFVTERLSEENLEKAKDSEIISVFVYSEIEKNLIDKLSRLKCIVTRSTGYDHIDTKYCSDKDISVLNIPSYGTETVAEHTFALILSISRKIVESVAKTRKGDFSQPELCGFNLYGKTLGVIGAGKIGRRVIDIAKAFGMKVLVYTKRPNPYILGVEDVSLTQILKESDILTFHVPYNKETHHMINMANLDSIKKGTVLINTARGAIIQTQAIVEGLERGIFSAAGLDVLEEECDLREEKELLTEEFLKTCDLKIQLLNHVLLTKENAIITPHNAFNSKESVEEMLRITAENILSFIKGEAKNKIN